MDQRILNFLKGMTKNSDREFPELTDAEITTLGAGLIADYKTSLNEDYVVSNKAGEQKVKKAFCNNADNCVAFHEMEDYYKGDTASEVKSFVVNKNQVPIQFLLKRFLSIIGTNF